ncbi:MAG: hypothetical protein WBM13_03005 [Bacteroidia bacterium]
MEKDKIKIGDCFTYNLVGDEKHQYGFIIININKEIKRNSIEAALVVFNKEDISDIDSFKGGLIYTHQIYNPQKSILGVFCYEFRENTLEMLQNFEYIGELKIDKSKFMIGSGGDALPEPKFSSLLIKAQAIIFADKTKTPLLNIILD